VSGWNFGGGYGQLPGMHPPVKGLHNWLLYPEPPYNT
jgi:hypothetical protein